MRGGGYSIRGTSPLRVGGGVGGGSAATATSSAARVDARGQPLMPGGQYEVFMDYESE